MQEAGQILLKRLFAVKESHVDFAYSALKDSHTGSLQSGGVSADSVMSFTQMS